MPLWQKQLEATLDELVPGVGKLVVTSPPTSAAIVPAEQFLDRDWLADAIRACGESLVGAMEDASDEVDVRPAVAASRFTRHYVSSLTAVALIGLANGVGLDLSAGRCTKVVDCGIPRRQLFGREVAPALTCLERPTTWAVDAPPARSVGELRAYVWRQLYGMHLAPLFAAVTELTGASSRLLWSNAAEWAAYVCDTALQCSSSETASTVVAESAALLDAETLPGIDGDNPLRGLVSWIDVQASDFPRGVQTRRHCCITYLLPARLGRLCQNCPFLPLENRIALTRETRDGAPRGGPAEERSIAIGLRKVRTHAQRKPDGDQRPAVARGRSPVDAGTDPSR